MTRLPHHSRTLLEESEKPEISSYCVTADLLIPGRGEPIKDGCIVVEEDKITHVGVVGDVLKYERLATLKRTHVEVLMPGMWGELYINSFLLFPSGMGGRLARTEMQRNSTGHGGKCG